MCFTDYLILNHTSQKNAKIIKNIMKNTLKIERRLLISGVNAYPHGIKGFVIRTKSFVKIGIAKIFRYNNKMFSSIKKTFSCCSKIFGCSNKKVFVPKIVPVAKPFFFRVNVLTLLNSSLYFAVLPCLKSRPTVSTR